jgi:hypothetical protein
MASAAPGVDLEDILVATAVPVPVLAIEDVASDPSAANEQAPVTVARRWTLSPRLVAFSGLSVAITLLVAITLARRISTDVFWQLAAGQWMIAHHHVVGLDPFSYTESHHRWVADEWGSEVILAELYKAFGAAAYNIISIATGTLCVICSMAYARVLGARGGRLAFIAVLVAVGISGFVTQDRGLSFSLIWLPLELIILTKARSNARWYWWLLPLSAVWVNTHGSILVAFAVIGVELAWSLVPADWVGRIGGIGRAPRPRLVAATGVGSVLAACISPYGPHLLTYDLGVATNAQIGEYIQEWQPPDFHSLLVLSLVLVPLAVLIAAVRRRQVQLLETTLAVAFMIGTLHSVRMVIYLIIVAVGLAASFPARAVWGERVRRLVGCGAIGLMIALVALPSVPAGTVTTDTPVQAFNFLQHHHGRIFTQYTWGDYSIARHRATFADGRTDLFVGTVLSQFFAVSNLTTNPDPILSHYDVDYVVWGPGMPLAEYLSKDAAWVEVFHTSQSVVFARRSVWDASGHGVLLPPTQ